MKKILWAPVMATLALYACDDDKKNKVNVEPLSYNIVARHSNPQAFDDGEAEITAYHNASQSILVINANNNTIDIFDASGITDQPLTNPLTDSNLTRINTIDVSKHLTNVGGINSVAVSGNLLAIAVQHSNKQANGWIAFYTLNDKGSIDFVQAIDTGALPDNVVFSPNGLYALSANEGEPSGDYKTDPEGSVTLVSIKNNRPDTVTQLDFKDFNQGGSKADLIDNAVRISHPNASVAQDLEPEYIAVNEDSTLAFISMQENNGYAIVDLAKKTITAIKGFGYKDHGAENNGLDTSDKDDAINIQNYSNLYGLYMPDSIASYRVNGIDYIVTANEGDGREYFFDASEQECTAAGGLDWDEDDGCLSWSDESRVSKLELDASVFASSIQDETQLGRLNVLTTQGDTSGDGQYEKLYSFGARSFSIFRADTAERIYDSGSDFEQITAEQLGLAGFNNDNDENSPDERSDAKGPEPEALALGKMKGQIYAFIGLERTGGIMMYNISNPAKVTFEGYTINRDITTNFDDTNYTAVGDLGPEGMTFVPANQSPSGTALLIVGNEISGSTTVYQVSN
ncbi:MAG: choice-of-anchor I family protein [Cellvibrionales bacterium]|nr:choice-of-anchor I family protein [Cellvibrionales bacterium]